MIQDIANTWIWLGFSVFILIALSVDTFLLGKKHAHAHESLRVALLWSVMWILCALIFNFLLWIYLYYAANAHVADEIALDFFTGYLIEKTLSIDNLFAFYLIFDQFRVPHAYQHRVFSYGIWGAIVLRLLLILLGTWLVAYFHWLLYIMGVFLLLTGIKMFFVAHQKKDLYASRTFQWLKRYIRITDDFHGQYFFVRQHAPDAGIQDKGKQAALHGPVLYATPLFIALLFVEISDLIFAFDSVPAIFAITTDPFIVWTSNIFAILGLRAMYFLLSGMVARFHLLKYGIALILIFVGFKMVIAPWMNIPIVPSLGMISGILVLFTGLSLKIRPR